MYRIVQQGEREQVRCVDRGVLPATTAGSFVLIQAYFPSTQFRAIKLSDCILHVSKSCKLRTTVTHTHTGLVANIQENLDQLV